MKVVSLNMRMNFGGGMEMADRLAQLVAAHEPDIALLQECGTAGLKAVCDAADLDGVHAHRVAPKVPERTFSPDGTAIAVRRPLRIDDAWRIDANSFRPGVVDEVVGHDPHYEPEPQLPAEAVDRLMNRHAGRALIGRIADDEDSFLVGSFHATPGSGSIWGKRVHKWKPYFHAGVAIALSKHDLPFVFGINANEAGAEVLRERLDEDSGWSIRVATLLGPSPMHRARDLLLEQMEREAVTSFDDAFTYDTGSEDGKLRYDSIWATPEFALNRFQRDYDAVIDAGGDHALLAADLAR